MTYEWQSSPPARSRIAASMMPPLAVEETMWDILLALHSDDGCALGLRKLAAMTSISSSALHDWLAVLEARRLITAVSNEVTLEVRAALTRTGRRLLDRYLSSADELQSSTRH